MTPYIHSFVKMAIGVFMTAVLPVAAQNSHLKRATPAARGDHLTFCEDQIHPDYRADLLLFRPAR